jgi:hypothetical protein
MGAAISRRKASWRPQRGADVRTTRRETARDGVVGTGAASFAVNSTSIPGCRSGAPAVPA